MRSAARILLTILAILVALPSVRGQEADMKTKDVDKLVIKDKDKDKKLQTVISDEQPEETPLKVQILISEFDGTQKISSLPYTLNMLGTGLHNRHDAHLRFGVKVPILAGPQGSNSQITYQDVGTNIDAMAIRREDDEYRLDLTVDRSSVTVPGKGTDWKPGESYSSEQPMIRSFKDEFSLILRSGQTAEGASAVDPVTGHLVKIEVTLTAAK